MPEEDELPEDNGADASKNAPAQEQRILITQALPGMVLSRPVVLPNKVTLCGRDTNLDDELIKRLTIRGIKRIYVQGQPLPAPSQLPFNERIRLVEKRFSRVHQIPLMSIVERCIKDELSRSP